MKIKDLVRPKFAPVHARAVPVAPKPRVKDELSTGRGGALRAKAAQYLGAQGFASKTVAPMIMKSGVEPFTTQRLGEAKQQMLAIRTDMKALDQRLASEMQQLGDGLTPAQQDAYRVAFREKNNYAGLEQKLADYEAGLAEMASQPGFLTAMQQVDPSETHYIYDALVELADGPYATQVLGLLQSMNGAELFQGTHFVDGTRDLIERTSTSLYTQELAKNPDDPQAAAAAMVQHFAPFMGDERVAARVGAFQTIVNAPTEEEAIRLFTEKQGLLGADLGAATYLALASKASLGGINAARGFKGLDGLASLFTKGLVDDGIATRVCESIGNAIKAPGVSAKLVGRLMPALGGLVSGLSRLTQDEKNAGTWVGIAGDVMAVAGGVLMASVVGAPVGFILAGVGTVVSVVGTVVDAFIGSDGVEAHVELLAQLVEQGVMTADEAAYAQERFRWPRQIDVLRGWGLDRTEVLDLLENHEELLKLSPQSLAAFTTLIQHYGVRPEEVNEFFGELAKDLDYIATASATFDQRFETPTLEDAQILVRENAQRFLDGSQQRAKVRATYDDDYGGL